jgi:hypothetical protein
MDTFVTYRTFKWFVACMYHLMSLQINTWCKAFVAQRTFKWFFTSMRSFKWSFLPKSLLHTEHIISSLLCVFFHDWSNKSLTWRETKEYMMLKKHLHALYVTWDLIQMRAWKHTNWHILVTNHIHVLCVTKHSSLEVIWKGMNNYINIAFVFGMCSHMFLDFVTTTETFLT